MGIDSEKQGIGMNSTRNRQTRRSTVGRLEAGRFWRGSWLLVLGPLFLLACCLPNQASAQPTVDTVAERMLLYQRANGGWPQPGGNRIDYDKPLSKATQKTLAAERDRLDTTIDDGATTREINYLVSAYAKTGTPAYLQAAERGIAFLLSAQNRAGGWPQFYPDSSKYRGQITYNDGAMIDVLWVMHRTATGQNGFDRVSPRLVPQAQTAVKRGIDCILKTQYRQGDKLTVWCAQHDRRTLLPTKARAFELPSLSGSESVGIVQFLMQQDNPSPEIKTAIRSAVAWFEQVKLVGIAVKTINDSNQPSGRDQVVVPDSGSTLWARFYDLETNRPFFTGRDSVIKYKLADIENERRAGYGWYGTWPARLLTKDYPNWVKKWGN
ncbi:pectate lyase [Rudanella lutea]|uniref:pectate lyase n=1 Tax=Rudanella lutea TaxID=451374 RepID=UPI00036567EF|nr:pectate lyase [Rudanella lutea]